MNDKELLDLAANAAGYSVRTDLTYEDGIVISDGVIWSPLTDDGDALRLAVKLKMNTYARDEYCIAGIVRDCGSPHVYIKEYCNSETKPSATRRAIVRAAAEIGKGL